VAKVSKWLSNRESTVVANVYPEAAGVRNADAPDGRVSMLSRTGVRMAV
jgi:hypothetical protein